MHGRQGWRLPNRKWTMDPKDKGKPSGLAAASNFVSDRRSTSGLLEIITFSEAPPSSLGGCKSHKSLIAHGADAS